MESKLTNIDQNWYKLTKNEKMAKIDQIAQIALNCPKFPKMYLKSALQFQINKNFIFDIVERLTIPIS